MTDVLESDRYREVLRGTQLIRQSCLTVIPGEREVFWIMNARLYTKDTLLFGAVQNRGILVILRKRLPGSFPVY